MFCSAARHGYSLLSCETRSHILLGYETWLCSSRLRDMVICSPRLRDTAICSLWLLGMVMLSAAARHGYVLLHC